MTFFQTCGLEEGFLVWSVELNGITKRGYKGCLVCPLKLYAVDLGLLYELYDVIGCSDRACPCQNVS